MDVSENSGTPKSSILIGFSIINHPFWGTPIFGNPHIWLPCSFSRVEETHFSFVRGTGNRNRVPPEIPGKLGKAERRRAEQELARLRRSERLLGVFFFLCLVDLLHPKELEDAVPNTKIVI